MLEIVFFHRHTIRILLSCQLVYCLSSFSLRNWTIFYTIAMATVAAAASSAYGWRNCELEQNFEFILHRIVDKGKSKREEKTIMKMEIGINLFVEVRKSIAKWSEFLQMCLCLCWLVMSFHSTYSIQSLNIASLKLMCPSFSLCSQYWLTVAPKRSISRCYTSTHSVHTFFNCQAIISSSDLIFTLSSTASEKRPMD